MSRTAFSRTFPFKTLLSFLGPGFLVTLGFIDPGNWAADISAGSAFGYKLLWVITLSTIILIVIQNMAAKLGIATGKSLSVNIKEHFPAPAAAFIGITIVLACAATDVAELIGGAIGFRLLLGLPLWAGALLTVVLKTSLIVTQRYHRLEGTIIVFLSVIALCYVLEIAIIKPDWAAFGPSIIRPVLDRGSIYSAMAILGAVVMPHNIFLHSNVIHSRKWGISEEEKASVLRFERIDTSTAMALGWLVNSCILIVAAAVFFENHLTVVSLEQAAVTLKPLAGPLAGLLFAVALLLAGFGSSVTSSMAEANVITGFLGKPEDPRTWLYRVALFVTAIPSFFVIAFGADTYRVLILSQTVLSIQLPFTIVPLIILCRSRKVMGNLRSRRLETAAALLISAIVVALNIFLLYSVVSKGS